VVEHLLCECKALSSNTSPTKNIISKLYYNNKKKEEDKVEEEEGKEEE
jgi:hypothetical protein